MTDVINEIEIMEVFSQYWNTFLANFGVWECVLFGLLVILTLIQILYYAGFGRIITYKSKTQQDIEAEYPPVSVVVAVGDDMEFVQERLPLLLAQDAKDYNLVVVFIGDEMEVYDSLIEIAGKHPYLTVTRITEVGRVISIKLALNIAIKSAKHDRIVVTTADTIIDSKFWARGMAQGLNHGDVVLGYSCVEQARGWANYMMRAHRLYCSVMWLKRAVVGKPYRGIRNSFGFTKTIYFGTRGFNHLNMSVGEDDLFVQSIATKYNTRVVISDQSYVHQKQWGGFKSMFLTRRLLDSAQEFYPRGARAYIRWESISRMLWWVTLLVALIVVPLAVKVVVVAIMLVRLAVVMHYMYRLCRCLDERDLFKKYVLFDIAGCFVDVFVYLSLKFRPVKSIWR